MEIKRYLDGKRATGEKLGSCRESNSNKRRVDSIEMRAGADTNTDPTPFVLKFNSDAGASFEDSAEHSLYKAVGIDWQKNHLITPLAYWQQPGSSELNTVMPFVEGKPLHSFRASQEKKSSAGPDSL